MGLETAPNFQRRQRAQRQFENTCIQGGMESSRWLLVAGDYSSNPMVYGHHPADSFRVPRLRRIPLSGYEIFLRDQMQAALSQKGDRPAVFLDLGGGAGESWSRLALYFRKEVTQGDALFVVSNLVFKPEQYYPHFELGDKVNPDVASAINQGLIQYREGPFSDLPDTKLTLPNGTTLTLDGNVSLVNEDKSLTNWTQTPEVDIPMVGGLLSPHGVYLVSAYDVQNAATASDAENKQNLIKGKEIAYQILARDFGIETVTTAEGGAFAGSQLEYVANKKPLAPKIIVN